MYTHKKNVYQEYLPNSPPHSVKQLFSFDNANLRKRPIFTLLTFKKWWVYLTALGIIFPSAVQSCQAPRTNLDPFYLKVVQQTLKISKTRSVHISSHDSEYSVTQLICLLQENHIPTTTESWSLSYHPSEKVVMLMIRNCADVLRLILGSVKGLLNATMTEYLPTRKISLSSICIEYQMKQRVLRYWDRDEKCEHLVKINEKDLLVGSMVPEPLFRQTRKLFHHPFWNAEKHIIFTIRKCKSPRPDRDSHCVVPRYNFQHRNECVDNRDICNHDCGKNLHDDIHQHNFHDRNAYFNGKNFRNCDCDKNLQDDIPQHNFHGRNGCVNRNDICYPDCDTNLHYNISQHTFQGRNGCVNSKDIYHPDRDTKHDNTSHLSSRKTNRCSDIPSHHNVCDDFDLLITFRFIWRFFRSRRVVICIDEECFNYDPSNDIINEYTDDTTAYFDFSPPALRGRPFSVFEYWRYDRFSSLAQLRAWPAIIRFVTDTVCYHLRGYCDALPRTITINDGLASNEIDFDDAIREDADAVVVDGSLLDEDFRDFDVISLIDPDHLSFVVPEKGHMPSYLMPARCFSKTVWLFTCGTVVLFIVVHEAYRRVVVKLRSSEDNPHVAERISTVFTVYSYVICVSRSRLLIDLFTGRILFGIFSFSFLILSSVFLSVLVENIGKRIRYVPINTIEELRESGLPIQWTGAHSNKLIFKDDPKFAWTEDRLTYSYDWYQEQFRNFALYLNFNDSYSVGYDFWSAHGTELSTTAIQSLLEGLTAAIKDSIFIIFLPHLAWKKDLMSVEKVIPPFEYIDFHIVDEYIMSYPYDIRLLSNSVYGPAIKAIVSHLKEGGILLKKFETVLDALSNFRNYEDEYDREPVRAFSMVDMKLAFVALTIGLVSSSLVFVAELLYHQ